MTKLTSRDLSEYYEGDEDRIRLIAGALRRHILMDTEMTTVRSVRFGKDIDQLALVWFCDAEEALELSYRMLMKKSKRVNHHMWSSIAIVAKQKIEENT